MNNKSIILKALIGLFVVGSLFVLPGCSKAKVNPNPEVDNKTGGQSSTRAENNEPVVVAPPAGFDALPEGMAYSPYTGIPMPLERVDDRPLAVMFDNLYKARPQKGLQDADIVYEALVEGLITRYMAVFHSKIPGEIGPVRSARPYFVRLALENDGYYSHIGGSNEAFSDIRKFKLADLDGMNVPGSTYWRKDHKPRPNNMYSSGEILYSVVASRKYRSETNASFWPLGIDEALVSAELDPSFKIVYKEKTSKDSIGYFVEFVYNEKATVYERLVNGKPHLDEGTSEQITAMSVIIQRVKTKVLDNVGRLSLALVGKGEGYYMCEGKRLKITWEKTAEAERTQYFDAQGRPIVIMPGQLWVQLVPSDFQLID